MLAESVGFTSVQVGEHHFCDYIVSSPPVVLAAIAERTSTLRLSTGVTLGVNLDPVRVAEDYATVDVLSGGRVEPCIGRGTFFPHTFAAFGQDPRQAHGIFAEHLELLLELWTHDEIDWRGSFRAPLRGPTTTPRPLQQPRPPIWLGAGASATSVELAARLGLWLMLPTVFGTPEHVRSDGRAVRGELGAARPRSGRSSHRLCVPRPCPSRLGRGPRPLGASLPRLHRVGERSAVAVVGGAQPRARRRSTSIGCAARQRSAAARPRSSIGWVCCASGCTSTCTRLMFDMGGLPDDELFATIELVGSEVIPTLD